MGHSRRRTEAPVPASRVDGHERWLSPSEIAVLVNVSRRSILRRIGSGSLPATRLPQSRLWRIRASDFTKWMTGSSED